MGAKAFAGAGSIPLSDAILKVAMWAFSLNPPLDIQNYILVIGASIFAYLAVYITPIHK